jgi:hypothetical protein
LPAKPVLIMPSSLAGAGVEDAQPPSAMLAITTSAT